MSIYEDESNLANLLIGPEPVTLPSYTVCPIVNHPLPAFYNGQAMIEMNGDTAVLDKMSFDSIGLLYNVKARFVSLVPPTVTARNIETSRKYLEGVANRVAPIVAVVVDISATVTKYEEDSEEGEEYASFPLLSIPLPFIQPEAQIGKADDVEVTIDNFIDVVSTGTVNRMAVIGRHIGEALTVYASVANRDTAGSASAAYAMEDDAGPTGTITDSEKDTVVNTMRSVLLQAGNPSKYHKGLVDLGLADISKLLSSEQLTDVLAAVKTFTDAIRLDA